MRRIVTILLIAMMPFQTIWAASGMGHGIGEFDMRHLADHAAGVDHHHGVDGSVHYDESDQSSQHMKHHAGCLSWVAILSDTPLQLPPQAAQAAIIVETPPLVQAFLDTLFRPPRNLG